MIRTVANLAFLSLFLITALLSPVYAAQYNYDNLHRLTRVIYDNGLQITYTYDEVGNCTRRVSTLMADISVNGTVDFQDFAILASQWLDSECHVETNRLERGVPFFISVFGTAAGKVRAWGQANSSIADKANNLLYLAFRIQDTYF